MTLTIETGAGVTGADSFDTFINFTAWEAAMFGASSTGTDANKEAAQRRAFAFMAGLDWLPDLWPTFGGTIPQAVKNGQHALARAELQSVGYLSPQVTLSGRKVLTGLKGLTWEVQSAPNTVEAARPVVTMAMDYLKPYLRQTGGTVPLERF